MTEQNEKESIKWYDNILMVMVGSVPVLCMSHLSVCLSTVLDNIAWGDSFEQIMWESRRLERSIDHMEWVVISRINVLPVHVS